MRVVDRAARRPPPPPTDKGGAGADARGLSGGAGEDDGLDVDGASERPHPSRPEGGGPRTGAPATSTTRRARAGTTTRARLRGENEKRGRTGCVRRRVGSNFLQRWHKKIDVIASPDGLPCWLGPTHRGRGGPGHVSPTVGANDPGRVGFAMAPCAPAVAMPFRSPFMGR